MTQKKLLKTLLLSGGFGAALAPIAIAASCGESSTTVVQNKTASVTFTNKIKADASSTHDDVTWVAAADPSIKTVQYFHSKTQITADAAKAMADGLWQSALPKNVDFEAANRFLWIKLTPATGYQLANNIFDITATSGIASIKSSLDAMPEIATFASGIKAVTDKELSVHNYVTWMDMPELPAHVSGVTYLSGDYANETAAKAAPKESWSTTKPNTVDYRPSKRHIWAQLETASGFTMKNPYMDLTTTSNITGVAVLIDAIESSKANFDKIDLTKITINGTWSTLQEVTPLIPADAGFTIPAYLQVNYDLGSIYSNGAKAESTFVGVSDLTSVKALINHTDYGIIMTDAAAAHFNAYLAINQSKVNELDPDFTGTINTKIQNRRMARPTLNVSALDPMKFLQFYKPIGTATALDWAANLPPIGYGTESIKFILGDYATKADVIAAGATAETDALPTTLEGTNAATRHLWAKVTYKAGLTLENNETYFDISAGIKKVA